MRVLSERQLAIALGPLSDTPRVVAGGNFATPWRALAVLDGAVARYRMFALNAQAGMPDREGVTLETSFVGPGMRGRGRLRYFPCRLSLVPALLASALPPDVVLIQTSVPVGGTVSLGTEVNILPAAIEAARARGGLVVAQLNPQVPYTYGDAELPCDAIDYAIEADAPLPSPPEHQATESQALIGDRVAALIGDGATVQAGIGAVPDAVLAGLHRRRGLAVWSEMFSDGVLGLAKAGALDPGQPVTASFAFGSADLYAWIDRNPDVRMLPHRDRQRPRQDRPLQADGLGQQRSPGRPARAGQRHLGQRAGNPEARTVAVGTRHSSLVPGRGASGSAGASRSSPPSLAARSARLRRPLRRPPGGMPVPSSVTMTLSIPSRSTSAVTSARVAPACLAMLDSASRSTTSACSVSSGLLSVRRP